MKMDLLILLMKILTPISVLMLEYILSSSMLHGKKIVVVLLVH